MNIQRMIRIQVRLIATIVLAMSAVSAASAATVPAGFTELPVASGLASPTAMQFAPDGRLFVCEQGGRLRVIKNGTLLSTPFLSVTVSAEGERGLLGVAFDPDFASNGYVYVYYTATTPTVHNRISRFTANGDVAVAGSEVVILDLDNLSGATNHNGGALAFGPDGKLYAAVGENANRAAAQSMSTVLGKMLRLNADGSIPSDNPFYGTTSGKNRAIWALGLRNPFTFGFNPAGTLFINDVGENVWEEIDEGRAGANYGWSLTEGPTSDARYTTPRYAYDHGSGCAITGGAFYTPQTGQFPSDYVNDYFFADYCSGWIRKLDTSSNTASGFATGITYPVDLKVSDDGSLYYLARGSSATSGVVVRITRATSSPTISAHPASATVAPGTSVTFNVDASGTPPLRYQWQRNGSNISSATAKTYTIAASQGDNGARFRAVVSNDFGNVLSNEAVLTVTGNQAPTATITQPTSGTVYNGGMTISYAGTATDPEEGALAASAFTWQVDFHHDTHTHPFLQPTTGASSGSFIIPTTGHTAANVWYRIYLTVRDASGLTHTTQRDVVPRIARLTLVTNPPGLQVNLDDQPVTTPYAFDSVVGIVRTLEAVTPQTAGAVTYAWTGWSDGGAVEHTLSTPTANTTYTATYGTSSGGGGGSGGGLYLSDLSWTSAVSGWGPVERDRSNGEAAAGDGDPLTLRGTVFAKGLGTHSSSDIRYALPAGCARFQAEVGVDDETGLSGSVAFEVWAGGARLYTSPVLYGGGPTASVDVALSGQTDLRLVVTNGGDGIATDHADWAAARITCSSGLSGLYLSDLSTTSAVNGWGPIERDRSNGETAAGDGGPITLRGAVFAKGLGVHAPSDVRFALPAGCARFQAEIGLDDYVGPSGSVVFEVWAGGAKLYASPLLGGTGPTASVDVALSGQTDLRLVVTDGGDGIVTDHADWAAARITCSSGVSGFYLSDLPTTSAVNGWGPIERDRSNGETAAGDGRPITLRGAVFAKGLGVHAFSDVRFTLPSGCSRLQAVVGVDDETGLSGSVVFEVWAGGVKLYSSPVLYGGGPTANVDVALSGQTDLRLVVTDGGNSGMMTDHADWAMAQVACGG